MGSTCDWETDLAVCDSEPVDEGGCCYGTDSKCDTDDESKCARMAKRAGCEWRAGVDADCSVEDSVDDEAGCCYSLDQDATAAHYCSINHDEADCLHKTMRQFGCAWLAGEDADCENPPTPEPNGCCHGNSIECFTEDENMCSSRGDRYGCEWRDDPDSCGGCCIGGWTLRDSDWDVFRDYQDDCDIAGTDNIACMTYMSWNRCGWKGADEEDENGLNYCATVAAENENGDGCCAQLDVGDPNSLTCHLLGKTHCPGAKCEWVSREEGRARYAEVDIDAPACQDDAPGDPAFYYEDVTLGRVDQWNHALPAALMVAAALMVLIVYRTCAAGVKKSDFDVANETQPLMA